jgi:hypothetical protein
LGLSFGEASDMMMSDLWVEYWPDGQGDERESDWVQMLNFLTD